MATRNRSWQEQRNAKELKARRLQPCLRCGQDIDYEADPWTDPNAFNAGHIKSYRDFPELRGDPANLRQEHANCNKAAGVNETLGLGVVSNDW